MRRVKVAGGIFVVLASRFPRHLDFRPGTTAGRVTRLPSCAPAIAKGHPTGWPYPSVHEAVFGARGAAPRRRGNTRGAPSTTDRGLRNRGRRGPGTRRKGPGTGNSARTDRPGSRRQRPPHRPSSRLYTWSGCKCHGAASSELVRLQCENPRDGAHASCHHRHPAFR